MHFIVVVFILASTADGYRRPKPRLVYPKLLEERSSDGRMVLHVHDDLTLNLRKASVAAPKLRVLIEENGARVTRFYTGEDIEKDLYEDEEKMATLHVTRTAQGVRMKGLVGPHHRIAPMPTLERSEVASVPHMIHELEEDELMDKYLNLDKPGDRELVTERQYGGSRSWPRVVDVEVFVVSDHRHYSYFQKMEHLLSYLCVVTNGANLRFSEARDPQIRLILTGFAKLTNEKLDELSDEDYIFDEGFIKGFRDYAGKNKNDFGRPDVVYFMTGRDVFTMHEGQVTARGLGIGYLGGVCSASFVALGEDKPGFFTGLHTYTHELAHTLGATHDGQEPDRNIRGHPSAVPCSWENGNIMSYLNKGRTHFYFSTCSLEQIQFVMRSKGQVCWAVSGTAQTWEGVYAGMTVSFETFCQNIFPGKQNVSLRFVDKKTCQVRCQYVKYVPYNYNGNTYYYDDTYYKDTDALDYMQCDENKVCIRGDCVSYTPREKLPTRTSPQHRTTTTTTTMAPRVSTREPNSYTTPSCHCDCSSTTATPATTNRSSGMRRFNFRDRMRSKVH
ncbi:metalloproteinase-like [Haemaphysalis longicornis]